MIGFRHSVPVEPPSHNDDVLVQLAPLRKSEKIPRYAVACYFSGIVPGVHDVDEPGWFTSDSEEVDVIRWWPIDKITLDGDVQRLLRAGRNLHEHAKILGWPDDGEGAYEYVQRQSYEAGLARTARVDNFGEEVTRLIAEIRKPCSMAWRDSLVEQLIELIDPTKP